MYIVAIAWIYVTLLMAVTETNITAAILTFCLYGLAPLALLLWLIGTPKRRHAARQRAAATPSPASAPASATASPAASQRALPGELPPSDPALSPLVDRQFGQPDSGNAKSDQ
jgi:hypothetical protein